MAENNGTDRYDMQSLQQEAIRRAREMQARAQIPPSYVPPQPSVPETPHPHTEQMPIHAQKPGSRPEHDFPLPLPLAQPIEGALDFLTKDSERSLILILLLILLEEKADTSMIFALMYLLI